MLGSDTWAHDGRMIELEDGRRVALETLLAEAKVRRALEVRRLFFRALSWLKRVRRAELPARPAGCGGDAWVFRAAPLAIADVINNDVAAFRADGAFVHLAAEPAVQQPASAARLGNAAGDRRLAA
ncbi:MAG: hypothetical protein IPK66_05040 [Rhodospirillales bacterium]|nr:hypothetical protein [Rhodospirillales bacterium]